MKIKIDKKKCIGCGACAAVCPKVFEIKNGKARVKKSKTNEKCIREAIENCPTRAISVEN